VGQQQLRGLRPSDTTGCDTTDCTIIIHCRSSNATSDRSRGTPADGITAPAIPLKATRTTSFWSNPTLAARKAARHPASRRRGQTKVFESRRDSLVTHSLGGEKGRGQQHAFPSCQRTAAEAAEQPAQTSGDRGLGRRGIALPGESL
jgi:hypothetical protein